MNKCKINIWGRAFELPLNYECYDNEEILESQTEAFAMLEDNLKAIADSLANVKKYIETTDAEWLADAKIDNIFKYVIPKSIFVPHIKEHRVAAIMCDYKFDPEHGIAVVFENGRFKEVGIQDIIL